MPSADGYSHGFYSTETRWARSSAEAIVPFLVDAMSPRSVVDVGCGLGAWLATFAENGVADVLGIDGEWVDASRLLIRDEQFTRRDLTRKIDLGRQFDLVLSLEVAEHLPEDAADVLIESLCRLGDVVVFGAAIPGQGGRHHVNEQWPEYWASRFAEAGYQAIDCIRPRFWSDSRVASFYAQNTVVFVDSREAGRSAALRSRFDAAAFPVDTPLSLVHPGVWDSKRLQPLAEVHSARELGFAFSHRVRTALAARARALGKRTS